jgi:hypothetical protein
LGPLDSPAPSPVLAFPTTDADADNNNDQAPTIMGTAAGVHFAMRVRRRRGRPRMDLIVARTIDSWGGSGKNGWIPVALSVKALYFSIGGGWWWREGDAVG